MQNKIRMKENDLNLDSRFDFAYETTKSIVGENPSFKNVFDIGSGNELMRERILKLGANYSSYDLFPANESVKKWNIEEPFPYDGKADIIIFLEVIEHINNPYLALQNLYNVLNKGGYIILSTPNPAWSGSQLSLLRNGYLDMFKIEDLENNHHVFIPWPHIVKHYFKEIGFKEIEYKLLGNKTSLVAYPFWGLKLPFRLIYRTIKKLIEANNKNAVGALYGLVAKK